MKETPKIPDTERSRSRLSSHRRFITLTTHASIVFAMSLAGSLVAGYFFLNYVAHDRVPFSRLLQAELLLPQIAVAMAITLGAGVIVMLSVQRRSRDSHEPDEQAERSAAESDLSTPILRLHRNAERLNSVEHSLMVRMSHCEAVDLNTRSMLAEMQMCTKRLMGGLAELDRNERHRLQPREAVIESDRESVVY